MPRGCKRDDGCLGRVNKETHKLSCKYKDQNGDQSTEGDGRNDRSTDAFLNPFFFFYSVVLSNENRKCISKILYRKIGKGINFHGCCKGSHNGCSEAVDQSLHGQNTKIHNGLLQAGEGGEIENFFYTGHAKFYTRVFLEKMRKFHQRIDRDTNARDILGNDRCLRSA